MARIEQSVEIHAPVEKVFDFVVSAWESKMGFFEGIYDWRPVAKGRMNEGFQIAYKAKILGVKAEVEMTVRDFVKNKSWIIRCQCPSWDGYLTH